MLWGKRSEVELQLKIAASRARLTKIPPNYRPTAGSFSSTEHSVQLLYTDFILTFYPDPFLLVHIWKSVSEGVQSASSTLDSSWRSRLDAKSTRIPPHISLFSSAHANTTTLPGLLSFTCTWNGIISSPLVTWNSLLFLDQQIVD